MLKTILHVFFPRKGTLTDAGDGDGGGNLKNLEKY